MRKALVFIFTALFISTPVWADELPTYVPRKLKAESLSSVGSDSMNSIMELWLEDYQEYQPKLDLNVASRGSATAPPALMQGVADIGPMARPMKEFEVEKFKAKFGFEPTQVRTAIAGVAVYVSDKNPLTQLSIKQLEEIFSAQPTRENAKQKTFWHELGVKGELGKKEIIRVGRVAPSMANSYFRQQVLLQKAYKEDVSLTADLSAVLQTLQANTSAIGVAEFSDDIPEGVKVLAIRGKKGPAVKPTITSIAAERYPLARFLSVYIVRTPGELIEDSALDFLNFVLSKQGQAVVEEAGLIPLSSQIVESERAKLK